jgi:large subunit GTPase 1
MHKHTTDIIATEKPKITSIIDQNSLEEFVQLAQLSNKNFTAEKEITIVNRKEILQGSTESANAQKELLGNFLLTDSSVRNPKYKLLKIPRRPKWRKDMSAEEIQGQENVAFLQWRRDIASIEENNMTLAITPFEKNLDVWRQLWRVIEKADVLLQIVDARNPYFYYSADLEQYIKDVDKNRGKKQFMLLINKADYLTDELREHWSKYFKEMNVNHVFFSALLE